LEFAQLGDEMRSSVCVCFCAQFLDFPGAKVGFVNKLKFVAEAAEEPVPCFRVLDEYGRRIKDSHMPEVGLHTMEFCVVAII